MGMLQTHNWREDHVPERFYSTLISDNTGAYPPILSGRMRVFTWGEKVYRNDIKLNQIKGTYYPNDTTADYVIANFDHFERYLPYYDSIDWSPVSKVRLLKKKKPLQRKKVQAITIPSSKMIESEFHTLYEVNLDSIRTREIIVGIDIELSSSYEPYSGWVVADISNRETGDHYEYESFAFNYIRDEWKNDRIINSFKMDVNTSLNQKIVVYIWNKKLQPFEIHSGKVELFELAE